MKNFLKDKRGETLVETLAAILIFTMGSIILYSMVTTAAKINRTARDKDNAIADQMEVAEMQKTGSDTVVGTGTVTMTIDGNKVTEDSSIKIFIKDGAEDGLYSYVKSGSAGGGSGV